MDHVALGLLDHLDEFSLNALKKVIEGCTKEVKMRQSIESSDTSSETDTTSTSTSINFSQDIQNTYSLQETNWAVGIEPPSNMPQQPQKIPEQSLIGEEILVLYPDGVWWKMVIQKHSIGNEKASCNGVELLDEGEPWSDSIPLLKYFREQKLYFCNPELSANEKKEKNLQEENKKLKSALRQQIQANRQLRAAFGAFM